MSKHNETIVELDSFLKKREGIDKVLKLVRYTSRLYSYKLLAEEASNPLGLKLKNLDSHLGTTRKALRLGKFVSNVIALRKALKDKKGGPIVALQAISTSAEGAYYFLDQFAWLMKAGVLEKDYEKELVKAENTFELVAYVTNMLATQLQLQKLAAREADIKKYLAMCRASDQFSCLHTTEEREELKVIAGKRVVLHLSLVQDMADALIAIGDLKGSDSALAHPVFTSVCGIISGSISASQKWGC
mmetsp:Transcript_13056/g.15739  ORF Transcript_13056/g.15739 Transcript_13056/m.15739 type:complete len:245 (+) Transcript_13056:116-850(+)|eukprot:CAMPEP_0197860630 /NCGR_PEP_ID=MMETSP1438-20131217/36120_1 /TAXON_ID=1461541 /ORGANISM="Pterosperma sp., Strain CCMP1384" /LENGTH=244 /DNA_ID=CAMNT_0043477565 /DNA_START=115 /DNA_END=849 /DNA_ORIENTATION=+